MTTDLNARIWHTSATAAEYADCHVDTILAALRSGELKGHQRKSPHGRWRIHTTDLDAWLRGESR